MPFTVMRQHTESASLSEHAQKIHAENVRILREGRDPNRGYSFSETSPDVENSKVNRVNVSRLSSVCNHLIRKGSVPRLKTKLFRLMVFASRKIPALNALKRFQWVYRLRNELLR
jgi:hypothetical protein